MPVIGEYVLSRREILRLRESRRAPGGARRRARTARRPIKVRLRGCGAVTLTVETHDKKRHLNNGVEPEGVKKAAHWSLDFPARNCVSDPDRPALVDLCQRTGVCRRDSGPLAASSERTDGDKAEKQKGAAAWARACALACRTDRAYGYATHKAYARGHT